jgi:hypothetical protein
MGANKVPRFRRNTPTDLIAELRKQLADLPADEKHPDLVEFTDDPSELEEDELLEAELDPEHPANEPHPKYRRRDVHARRAAGRFIWINGHRYACRNPDSGFRVMRAPGKKVTKQWTGGTAVRATDVYLKIPVSAVHVPADVNESDVMAELLERTCSTLGARPENVVTDRGTNQRPVGALLTTHEIGHISPFRKPTTAINAREKLRADDLDEYGTIACDYCGSPTARLKVRGGDFVIKRGKPYIRSRCANPHTPECLIRLQLTPCEREWLLLGVVSHEEELYFQLRRVLREREKAHHDARTRHGNEGKDERSRLKRLGIPFLELRDAIARFLDIFRICLRMGWIGTHERKGKVWAKKLKGGSEGVKAVKRLQRMKGLLLPRGEHARKLGLLFEGEIPQGWTPVAECRAAKKAQRKKSKAPPAKAPPADSG